MKEKSETYCCVVTINLKAIINYHMKKMIAYNIAIL